MLKFIHFAVLFIIVFCVFMRVHFFAYAQNSCVNGCSCPLQLKGDINCDGTINLTDFEIWRKEYFSALITGAPTPTISTNPTTPSTTPTITPKPTNTLIPTPTTGGTTSWWKPTPDQAIHWHWQLSENFQYPRDVLSNVTVYDIDGEQTSAATVAQLHALSPNVKVICYIDVGVYEDYRSDANKFPQSVIGKADTGWQGSYWLDIRQTSVLRPIMEARIRDWCKGKGFDAVEPDESEVSNNDSGFTISQQQNIAYSQMIADIAHSYGLSIGLKGNNAEAANYVSFSDWSLSEQCFEYGECDSLYNAFITKGKAVFVIEYNTNPDCTWANSHHVNAARRDLNLVGPTGSSYRYTPCIPNNQSTWQ